MNTNWPYRVTIAVPKAMIPDANQLALVLGETPRDVETFDNLRATDGAGTYAVTCVHARASFPNDATSALVAPDHSPDADLAAAGRAQAALVIGDPSNPPVPSPDRIAAILAPNDRPDPLPDHLAALGLTLTGGAD